MPLGSVEPFGLSVKKFNKATNAQIALGKACVRNEALTPDGWKLAGADAAGPFVVAVIDLAETTDAYFSGAQAPSEVIMEAGDAIQPGSALKVDTNGDVVAADTLSTAPDDALTIIGRYLGKEGDALATAAADGDKIRVKLGGLVG
jgi:hypothetical protein